MRASVYVLSTQLRTRENWRSHILKSFSGGFFRGRTKHSRESRTLSTIKRRERESFACGKSAKNVCTYSQMPVLMFGRKRKLRRLTFSKRVDANFHV